MKNLVFYFDQNRCLGCNACQIACKDLHSLALGVNYRNVMTVEYETVEGLMVSHYSGTCNHCRKPKCVKACALRALYQDEDGTIVCSSNICVGCGNCIAACPYSALQWISGKREVHACDSCQKLRRHGKSPACVDACITHCLEFGTSEQIEFRFGPGLVSDLAFLPDSDITHPRLLIRPKLNGLKLGGCYE